MVTKILQTWYHIEEFHQIKNSRKVRQVIDLITNDHEFKFDELNRTKFVGIKVSARNDHNNEIPFLDYTVKEDPEKNFSIILNFDPLSRFPPVPEKFIIDDDNLKEKSLVQIKLEIEYILTEVEENIPEDETSFEKFISIIEKIGVFFLNIQKTSMSFIMEGQIQPEFYITVPKGWMIGKFLKEEGQSVRLQLLMDTGVENLLLDAPYIKINSNQKTYNYLINEKSYESVKKRIEAGYRNIGYKVIYFSHLDYALSLISLIPYYVFLYISTYLMCYIVNYHNVGDGAFHVTGTQGMAYLIGLLSFSYFYYSNLIFEGYNLPKREGVPIIIAFSLFVIVLILFLSM